MPTQCVHDTSLENTQYSLEEECFLGQVPVLVHCEGGLCVRLGRSSCHGEDSHSVIILTRTLPETCAKAWETKHICYSDCK